jgi:transcription elongation factor GreA
MVLQQTEDTHEISMEGLNKLKAELEEIITVKKPEIAEKLKEAISYGDISENAEFDAAKEEQAAVEQRVRYLEERIRDAIVIDDSKLANNVVGISRKVRIRNCATKEEIEFTIVGEDEANSAAGMISQVSPVGKNLMNRKKGDKVEFAVPAGMVKYEILDVQKADKK